MASTLASQLQAIKSVLKGTPDPIRRPLTRPSVLFDPKEAADIDLRTILPIALSGLGVLIDLDERFRKYGDTLFSQTSLELDREKMVSTENEKLDRSIHSYLRLLSGHLQLPAALKTLEYLIRRYQIHVYNRDELLLCALPFHDTHAFVRIVQLLDLGNSMWVFLEGVKSSGAPPPRNVLVQQCIRDKGLLEALCNYASSTKEFQHSTPVICFCTAAIVECLGALPKLDTDAVQRVLGFVFNGLNLEITGERNHKAGALMVVGILATRATLTPKLIQSLMFFIARMVQHDMLETVDLLWLRVTIMAIITLAQSQSVKTIPKKSLMILKDIRDFPGVLLELSNEFNIKRFMNLYVESLLAYGSSEDSCFSALISAIEVLPLINSVEKIVSKVLAYCVKMSRDKDTSNLQDTGKWAKEILVVIEKRFPLELHASIRKFLEANFRKDESIPKALCVMFDGSMDAMAVSDSKLWFSLEHPKAVVRQSALSKLSASGILKNIAANPQNHFDVQNAIIRGLYDDDLSVVKSALSVDGLAGVFDPSYLLKAYDHVLSKCMEIIDKGFSKASRACKIAISCLKRVDELRLHHSGYSKDIATMIFPLLLVHPKTWEINLKSLELAKQLKWPFYMKSTVESDSINFDPAKNLDSNHTASINMRNIISFAETVLANPQEHMQWLVECGNHGGLSESLFLIINLQALLIPNKDVGIVLKLYQACFPALKKKWSAMESKEGIVIDQEINMDKFDKYCKELVNHIFKADTGSRNAKILLCIFWGLLKAYSSASKQSTSADISGGESMLNDLFLFFITSCTKNAFKEHLQFLLINCTAVPFEYLLKYFVEGGFAVEVQCESLHLFSSFCSICALSERSISDEDIPLQLLLAFPSILVPLCHENKDVRTSAMKCVEGLFMVWRQCNKTKLPQHISSTSFGVLLESLVNQKKMILSDAKFISTYLTAILSLSSHVSQEPVAENPYKRSYQPVEDDIFPFILRSALTYSSYGKLVVLSLLKGMGLKLFQVEDVKSLLLNLLDQRNQYHFVSSNLQQKLSNHEIEMLCVLLEVSTVNSVHVDVDLLESLIKALRVDGYSADDPAVVRPCVTVLRALSSAFYDNLKAEMQDKLFGSLVILFRNENAEIRNATRDALLRININHSTLLRLIEFILSQADLIGSSKRIKKNNVKYGGFSFLRDSFSNEGSTFFILVSLLDILLMKKDMEKGVKLVQPLFNVLSKLFANDLVLGPPDGGQEGVDRSEVVASVSSVVYLAQQTTLFIIKEIADSLELSLPQDDLFNKGNIDLLVECARSAKDVASRNNVFLLLSSTARVSPQLISENVIDIFTVVGESAVKQDDSHSQDVLENLISTLVPCWLSRTTSIEKLLQIFIEALPDVAEHRRLTLLVYLLRALGEGSLGTVIVHLLHSLVLRVFASSPKKHKNLHELCSPTIMAMEWEHKLAVQICNHYPCKVWFPCLVKLLHEMRVDNERELFAEVYLAMQFILFKLQDTELVFELESGRHMDHLQVILGELMGKVVFQLQLASGRRKLGDTVDVLKAYNECANRILKTVIRLMTSLTYFTAIAQLLGHADPNVKRKTLWLLCDTLKDNSLVEKKRGRRKLKLNSAVFTLAVNSSSTPAFNELCLKITGLIDHDSDPAVKIAAISALDMLSKEYPSDCFVYGSCLTSIVNHICSDNLAISSGVIRTAGSFIKVLGSKALPQLPLIMKWMLQRAHEVSHCPTGKSTDSPNMCSNDSVQVNSLLLSILLTLEAIVENLSGFLNPYLDDILDLVILHSEFALELDTMIHLKATNVRRLLADKLPLRIMLPPLLQLYSSATKCGEASISLTFQILASLISKMDRQSTGTYHAKIFEYCLTALDLRHQLPNSVNINMVEESVIHAIIVLTMKLTETMFMPLFLHCLEWAESEAEGSQSNSKRSLDRVISFYKLVNKLAEQHRSLFVPYFKYLLEGCVRYLMKDQEAGLVGLKRKSKKVKVGDEQMQEREKALLPKQWHLRALILKSLHKCFLYDTDLKILDSSNFEVLLKPIVSQLMVEPPEYLESVSDAPTVEEMDETLILCLGQMAVTARSDVLWKPLNHEVLMQTRNEKARPKILGLKIVKYLVDHLKEEYLVFLPETIPFLGELLEDSELPVKTLAQEILREMESLSGEKLTQYL